MAVNNIPTRPRSQSRQRSQSRGRTSVSNFIIVPGMPESLTLAHVNREYSPPKGEDETLKLEAEYHEQPPHANNFTNAEIFACAAHGIRAHHDVQPPDINIYHATREVYNLCHSEMSDTDKDVVQIRAYELDDQLGEEAGLIVLRPDKQDAEDYYHALRVEYTKLGSEYPANHVPEDLAKYGKIKAAEDELRIAMDYLTWFDTAKVGYIYIYICQGHT